MRYFLSLLLMAFFSLSSTTSAAPTTTTEDRRSTIQFQENFEQGLSKQWQDYKFDALTEYRVVQDGTNAFLQATAKNAASALVTRAEIIPQKGLKITWRWKINECPKDGSDTEKAKFDHTARIFIAFKTLIGPPWTINYVWSNQTPVGKTYEHPSTGRSRFLSLQNGNKRAGEWIMETRHLAADWELLFGKKAMPEIAAIGLMTDSDGTQTNLVGCYDDIQMFQE